MMGCVLELNPGRRRERAGILAARRGVGRPDLGLATLVGGAGRGRREGESG